MSSELQTKELERLLTEDFPIGDWCAQASYGAALMGQRWNDALVEIEKELAANSSDLAARLAWVDCQLELETVPVTALSSQLGEVSGLVSADNALCVYGARVILKAIVRLVSKDKLRLAVVEFEKVSELCQASSLASAVMTCLNEFGSSLISQEIERAEKRREERPYIQALEQKLELIKRDIAVQNKVKKAEVEESQPKLQPRTFTSKSLLADLESSSDEWVAGNPETDVSGVTEGMSGVDDAKKNKARKSAIVLVAAIVVGWGGYKLLVGELPEEELNSRLVIALASPLSNELRAPEIGIEKERNDEGAAISALALKRVQDRLTKLGESLAGRAVPSSSSSSQASIQAQESSSSSEPASVSISPDLPDSGRVGFDQDRAKDSQRTPDLNPDKVGQRTIEALDSADRKMALDGLRMGRDGRVYGPPADVTSDKNAGDKSDIRAFEVEQFPQPMLYQTIVGTNVLSAPSSLAYSVGRLEVDQKVHVVAKLGPWLELVSLKGRKGYIYAQDAKLIGNAPPD